MRNKSSNIYVSATALLGTLVLSGCSFVALAPEAETVRIIDEQEAATCEGVGTTRVKVLDKILFVNRSPEKMGEELDTLARNAVVDFEANLNANAVAPTGPIEQGKRGYRVLRCP